MIRFTKYLFLFLLVAPFVVYAFDIPARPAGFVNDYAGILTVEQKSALEAKINAFEKSTTNEIAVVAVTSLDGNTIENLAQEIFTKWGIGKAEKNNGVLFLIAFEDKEARIHTGYGVEGDLTDLGTSYIQQDIMVPAFRAGDYYAGINGAVDKIIEALGGNNIVPEEYVSQKDGSSISVETILFLAIVILQVLAAILGKSKEWWHGGVLGGGVGLIVWHFFIASIFAAVPLVLGLIGLGLFFDYMVSRAYSQKATRGVYPWWFGGGRGGGGGGFGGFGGGFSGGGGSSSRW